MNEKEKLINGGNLLEYVGHERKKVIWELVDNNGI